MKSKVALVTGGAKRIGATIAESLHQAGMNVIIHYRNSQKEAEHLAQKLNLIRPHSVVLQPLDLLNIASIPAFLNEAVNHWGRLDVLVNNASSFYATPLGTVTLPVWNDLFGSNLVGPFFLSQAAMAPLTETRGCIINLVDIKIDRPNRDYTVYTMAKAGLWMMTKSLAKELAPYVRVNAIAPGAMIRPEKDYLNSQQLKELTHRIPLQRIGDGTDIAKGVHFLIHHDYLTGQMITIDGGRSLLSDDLCD